jgi:hypothetical protein
MGNWQKDQSKNARRYVWGQTRGEHDAARRDFLSRAKVFPAFAPLRIEKIGSELHLWREIKEPSGKIYWTSCLRFVDNDWGYWTVYFRPDERRWRAAGIKELPISGALEETARLFDSLLSD